MLRLVSAYYEDYYPFDRMGMFSHFISSSDPNILNGNDVLLVWGGEDIHPSLYGHIRHGRSHAGDSISRRDRIEWTMMQRAKELGIPIIGICRGAQMLCALDGGYLIQDVNNHGGDHIVHTFDGEMFITNSLHHQQMVPRHSDSNVLVAWTETRGARYHHTAYGEEQISDQNPLGVDPEFIHFKDIKGFAIQWHPEMKMYPDIATDYVFNYLRQHIQVKEVVV